ncbi:MAG: DUF2934 domain-containing protein [Opitutaceae bacterium]|jgi:hypothetical protein
MKKQAKAKGPRARSEPAENDIRVYAYHLYLQGNRAPGHDTEDWLEAKACLKANIPSTVSRTRLHRYLNEPQGDGPPLAPERITKIPPDAKPRPASRKTRRNSVPRSRNS